MGGNSAIQGGVDLQNSRDAADARENAILLGENGASGELRRIDRGVAGRVARGAIFEQRVLDNGGKATRIPIHWTTVLGSQFLLGLSAVSCQLSVQFVQLAF